MKRLLRLDSCASLSRAKAVCDDKTRLIRSLNPVDDSLLVSLHWWENASQLDDIVEKPAHLPSDLAELIEECADRCILDLAARAAESARDAMGNTLGRVRLMNFYFLLK